MRKYNYEEYIGKKFNLLTIVEISKIMTGKEHESYTTIIKCDCECGNITNPIPFNRILVGNTKSCGCIKETDEFIQRARKYEPRIASAKYVYTASYDDGSLSFDQFLELSQKNCYYCDSEPSNKINYYLYVKSKTEYSIKNGDFIYNGLDRMNNDLPHNIDNVVPCCKTCNVAKLDNSLEDFASWVIKIHNNWAAKFRLDDE